MNFSEDEDRVKYFNCCWNVSKNKQEKLQQFKETKKKIDAMQIKTTRDPVAASPAIKSVRLVWAIDDLSKPLQF